ncbi:MAG TPA: hypothetical protein VF458_20710 [Ktedonobacteraceae bacterium]
MSKSLCRLFYLFGILALLIGGLLLTQGYAGRPPLPGGVFLPGSILRTVRGITILTGLIVLALASLSGLASWLGALVRTAHLRRWGWFISLLVFTGIALLLYVFAGPTTPPPARRLSSYAGFGD